MDFEDLATAILVLADILREPIAAHRLGSEWKNSMSLTSARVGSQRKNGTQKPILSFVRGNVGKRCRNDLDRIYALLGLRNNNGDIEIDVRFDENVEDVYKAFALGHLRKGDLSVLHCAGKTNEASDQHQETSLPTWVLDWRCNFKLVEGSVGGKDIPHEIIFNALTQSPASILVEKDSTSFIGIAGALIGTVNELSKFLVVSPTSGLLYSYEEYQGLVKAHSLYFEVSKGKPYPTGEDSERAFARTIVMDNRTPRSTFSLGRDVEPELLLYNWLRLKKSLKDMSLDEDIAKYMEDWPQAHREAAAYLIVANNVSRNRQFLMIESGYIGLAPIATEKDDAIVVFDGAETPFILRRLRPNTQGEAASEPDNAARHTPKEQWELIGDCYVHGFMDGEASKPEYDDKRQTFWIT